jgi:hypothetical protein
LLSVAPAADESRVSGQNFWPAIAALSLNAEDVMTLQRTLWFFIIAVAVWAGMMQLQLSGFDRTYGKTPGDCTYLSANPVLDLELSSSGPCFQEIVEQGVAALNMPLLRANTILDIIFIFLYGTMLALFAFLTGRTKQDEATVPENVSENKKATEAHTSAKPGDLGLRLILAGICLTVIADILEDCRICSGLNHLDSLRGDWLTPHWFSVSKWILFASVLAGLAVRTWSTNRILSSALALASALTIPGIWLPQCMAAAVIAFSLALAVALLQYYPFSLQKSLLLIEYTYLLRFPFAFGLILLVALPAGFFAAPSIFLGLFDAPSFVSYILVVWASLQLAWTVMATTRLVLAYGRDRFPGLAEIHLQPVGPRTVVVFALLALPCIVLTMLASLDVPAWKLAAGTVVGTGLALGVLFAATLLYQALERSSRNTAADVLPAFGKYGVAYKAVLSRKPVAPDAEQRRSFIPRAVDQIGTFQGLDLRAGIWDDRGLRSGHVLAGSIVVVLLVIYAILGAVFFPGWRTPEQQPAALFYVLFLLTLLTWVLAGVAFFLDKLRLPVFASILLFSLLTGSAGTDHEFSMKPGPNPQDLSPAALIKQWQSGPRRNSHRLTVVSTAGGGIRAAAWTAEVLTGLQEACGPQFTSSVLLISSVSGGSVGSMHFLSAYDSEAGTLPPGSADRIRSLAARSSLGAVGWGFLYPDFLRMVPFAGVLVPQNFDRGWALENAWVSHTGSFPDLSGWRDDAGAGRRPSAIFNGTAAESGERFMIASTDTDDPGTVAFSGRYAGWDVPIATAARLSATFPFVTPMARASGGPRDSRFHIADGGYYDNSGVLSAIAWLRKAVDQAEREHKAFPYQVLFLAIDSEPSAEAKGRLWSWQRQISAPIETLKNVRTSSQDFRDRIELDTAVDALKLRNVKISVVPFVFRRVRDDKSEMQTGGLRRAWLSDRLGIDVDTAPLSWHLNQAQRASIGKAWRADKDVRSAEKTVRHELDCDAAQ